MKKKIIACIVLILFFLLGGTIFIYKYNHYIGSAKNNITSEESSNCTFTFNGKENDIIKFTYASQVKKGTLKLQIINSSKDIIKDFPINSDGSVEIVINNDDMYRVVAEYSDFVGEFKLAAYR